ncbi:hypothetical protein P3T23_004981 [Paraburkholderia sp. GAS448]|uniref:hypothetical protein n=1 Tax=Paraburkholderia sp. GAS448 TaxID=3035136 RepID=UPI003D235FFE
MTINDQPSALLPCPFCAREARMKTGGDYCAAICVDLPRPGYQMALAVTSGTAARSCSNSSVQCQVTKLRAMDKELATFKVVVW